MMSFLMNLTAINKQMLSDLNLISNLSSELQMHFSISLTSQQNNKDAEIRTPSHICAVAALLRLPHFDNSSPVSRPLT